MAGGGFAARPAASGGSAAGAPGLAGGCRWSSWRWRTGRGDRRCQSEKGHGWSAGWKATGCGVDR